MLDTITLWLNTHAGLGFAMYVASMFGIMARVGFFRRMQ